MKKNRLGSAEVGSCICYGLMALLQVGWLAVLLTAQLVPPVWVTLMVYCVGRWRCSYWDRRCGWCSCGGDGQPVGWSVVLGVAVASVWLWQMLKVSHAI